MSLPTASPARYESAYYRLADVVGAPCVVLHRTETPYEATVSVRTEVDRVVAHFHAADRAHGIIVDMRLAPPRNDDEFEAAMRHLRFVVGRAFARVVVLLRSASGVMQATRLHREGGYAYSVTQDEDEALRIASDRPEETDV